MWIAFYGIVRESTINFDQLHFSFLKEGRGLGHFKRFSHFQLFLLPLGPGRKHVLASVKIMKTTSSIQGVAHNILNRLLNKEVFFFFLKGNFLVISSIIIISLLLPPSSNSLLRLTLKVGPYKYSWE